MPFFLCDAVGSGREGDRIRPPFAGSWISLVPPGATAGKGLLYLPTDQVSQRLVKVADDAGEGATGGVRTRLGNDLGLTLSLARGGRFADLVAELLMDHGRTTGGRWTGIRGFPSKRRQQHEIWLGGRIIWSESVAPGPHSQTRVETWPTNSEISTGQDHTWTQLGVGTLTASSGSVSPTNQNQECPYRCESTLDTGNQELTTSFAFGGTGPRYGKVALRYSDESNLYAFESNRALSEAGCYKIVTGSLTDLFSASVDVGASGSILLTLDGASISGTYGAYADSATDGSPSLTTTVKGGIHLRRGPSSTVSFGAVTIADIVAAGLSIPIAAMHYRKLMGAM